MKQHNQIDIYRVIADPNRRKILALLQSEDRPVQWLQSHLGITMGGVSQHLKLLRESGLVSRTREGRLKIYHLEAGNLREVDKWLAQFRYFWEDRLDRLGVYLDKKAAK